MNACAVVVSVFYYFAAIKRADHKLLGKPTSAMLDTIATITYWAGFITFTIGFVLAVVGVILYPRVQLSKTSLPTPPSSVPHYKVSISGPIRDRRGTHVHTLLVNETTGEVWRLDCGDPSGIRFLRVSVQDIYPPTPKNEHK